MIEAIDKKCESCGENKIWDGELQEWICPKCMY